MDFIVSSLSRPELTALVDVKIFAAILLALLAYRLIAPIVDFVNPFFLLLSATKAISRAVTRKPLPIDGAGYPKASTDLPVSGRNVQ